MRADPMHTARVLLAESRARGSTPFAHTLLVWAGNARRRAAAAKRPEPQQPDLFTKEAA
jgi:hypothetical protein